MSGVGAQVIGHVVRRGLEQLPPTSQGSQSTTPPPEFKLEIPTITVVALAAIAVVTFLIVISVDYTVGSLMATLTMIESPSTTTIVESAPPPYSDEPDAPLQKKSLEAIDVEVVVIDHKPVTARVVTTIKHLHRIGGFTARWRGLFQNIVYHIALNVLGHASGGLFGLALGAFPGQILGYIFAAIALCRVHMLWTHAMIAMPTNTRWYKRFVSRKDSKALLLPSLVMAVSAQLTLLVPVLVLGLTGLEQYSGQDGARELGQLRGHELAMVVLRGLAVPASALVMAVTIYLPAATTLTRIEACLLPEDQETVVPFDRQALIGDIDLTQRSSSKQLFAATWKSFNNSIRFRLVKLYAKLFAFQFAVVLVGVHLALGVIYLTGREQMINTIKTLAT